METRLSQFRTSLWDWLARNELDHDSQFYTPNEWRSRGENLLLDAELILVTEGGLQYLLNYDFDHPKLEELDDLCGSFGYWFELGHSWSVGFYPLDQVGASLTGNSYCEKLRDPRWKKKAALVKQRAGNKCEDCGSSQSPLEAHHCWYRYGFEPWQYPLDAFRCLCRSCHSARPKLEHHLRADMARFSHTELRVLQQAVQSLFHWYDRRVALDFVMAIGPRERAMIDAVINLAKHKTESGSAL